MAKKESPLLRLNRLNVEYHQLLGWRRQNYGNGGGYWHKPGCDRKASMSRCECNGNWMLPRYDDNAGLLIEELNRVCGDGDGWLLEQHKGETVVCASSQPMRVKDVGPMAFCEAALMALIHARKAHP